MLTRIPSGIWLRLLGAMCERHVSSQHMVKSLTLNPYMSLFNLKLWTHIWLININFRPPITLNFLVRTGLNFHPMGELWGDRGRLGRRHFFVTDRQKCDYLRRASQRARGATNNQCSLMYTATTVINSNAIDWPKLFKINLSIFHLFLEH